tara:strand:- start:308 stop:583 length:276 start_codon:yes stop_codon:yes gene_type:complete
MNYKELTPEQRARQVLAIEAFKEQVAYERSQRRKLAKVAKDTVRGLVSLLVLGMVAMMFFSCEKEELEVPCVWTELTIAGDPVTEWVCLPY